MYERIKKMKTTCDRCKAILIREPKYAPYFYCKGCFPHFPAYGKDDDAQLICKNAETLEMTPVRYINLDKGLKK
jgi:hypothetical protein